MTATAGNGTVNPLSKSLTCLYIQTELCQKKTLRGWLEDNIETRKRQTVISFFTQVYKRKQCAVAILLFVVKWQQWWYFHFTFNIACMSTGSGGSGLHTPEGVPAQRPEAFKYLFLTWGWQCKGWRLWTGHWNLRWIYILLGIHIIFFISETSLISSKPSINTKKWK